MENVEGEKEVEVEVVEEIKVDEQAVKEQYASLLESTGGAGSDDEDVYDEEHDVVQIESDEEEDDHVPARDGSKQMVCLRCPSRKKGTFTDREKYLFHIKRHVVQGQFACPTCRRPFIKITHCISHEMRVHGTEIKYFPKDPVVEYARKYLEKKEQKRAEAIAARGESQDPEVVDLIDSDNEESASETDEEDRSFYENLPICSTGCTSYIGPAVEHSVEAYEIQLFHSKPKYARGSHDARLAILAHKRNYRLGREEWKLGRFSGKQVRKPRQVVTVTQETDDEPEVVDNAAGPSGSPKKPAKAKTGAPRKPVDSDLPSSSSYSEKDDSDDEDYRPPERKTKKKLTKKTDKLVLKKKEKQQQVEVRHRGPTKLAFPPEIMSARMCQKCSYVWKSEVDLRTHRDAIHPNIPLVQLMAVKVPARPNEEEDSSDTTDSSSEDELFYATIVKKQSKKKQSKAGVQKENKTGETEHSPEKEAFLLGLGLVNNAKLESFRGKRKCILKPCKVSIERLPDAAIRRFTSGSYASN